MKLTTINELGLYSLKSILVYVAFLFLSNSYSQENTMDYIVLKTVIKDNEQILNNNNSSKLQSRITQIATNYGFSAVEGEHNFTLSIDVHLYEKNVLTGLKKSIAINGEIFFNIYNTISNIQYSSLTYQFNGVGDNQNLAVSNAIKNISYRNSSLGSFFNKAKSKILDYYSSNCDNLIASANNKYNQQRYSEVLKDLSSIPLSIENCKPIITELLNTSYIRLQNKNCSKLILKGKSELANNEYKNALNTFSYIDPESICYSEAIFEIQKIESKINETDLLNWNYKIKKHNDKIELEKYRLDVLEEIAYAYYNRKPLNTNLDLIIIK